MQVTIKYLGLVYSVTKVYKESIEVREPADLKDVLNIIFTRYPKVRDLIILEDFKLNPLYRILINGRDIEHLDGLDTKVEDGDVITLSTPFGG